MKLLCTQTGRRFCNAAALALLLPAAGFAGAQSSGSTVSGKVLCSDTQKPARFAGVMLVNDFAASQGNSVQRRNASGSRATTDVDGSFVINDVAPGVYDVQVSLPGYVQPLRQLNLLADSDPAAQQPWLNMLTRVTVTEGQNAAVVATAYRGADLLGTVLYDDGTPAAGLTVQTFVANPAGGSTAASTSTSLNAGTNLRTFGVTAQTDDRGRFYLSGLAEGVYTVQALSRGGSIFPVYLGNTIDRAKAEFLKLRAGEERADLEVQMDISNLHQVRGTLISPEGHALPATSVTLALTDSSADTLRAVTAADGSFSFNNVPDGKFTVSVGGASDPDTHQVYRSTSTAITVNGRDITDVALTPAQ